MPRKLFSFDQDSFSVTFGAGEEALTTRKTQLAENAILKLSA